MIVLDASALIELVLRTATGRSVAACLADPAESLHVPHLADLEVAQVLRRVVREGEVAAADAAAALANYRALDLHRHAHELLLDRVWELRANVTAYDAVYVALAEVLDAALLTCDRALARAPAAAARVQLIQAY